MKNRTIGSSWASRIFIQTSLTCFNIFNIIFENVPYKERTIFIIIIVSNFVKLLIVELLNNYIS